MNQLLLPNRNYQLARILSKGSICFPGIIGLLFFLFISGWTTIAFSQAKVTTDKLDYIPGETAFATGSGFAPNSTVTITIHEDPVIHPDVITTFQTNATGSFSNAAVYTFEDHDFGSSFILTATDQYGNKAVTLFTDGKGNQHWADEDLEWNNNILSDNKSDYFEGQVIPHAYVIEAANLVNNQDYTFDIIYNYYQSNTNAGGFAYVTTYNLNRQPTRVPGTPTNLTPTLDNTATAGSRGFFYTVKADIISASAPINNGSINDKKITVTFQYTGSDPANDLIEIYYGLYIAEPGQIVIPNISETKGASSWTGGSLQTNINSAVSSGELLYNYHQQESYVVKLVV